MTDPSRRVTVGVDGCKAGWVAVTARADIAALEMKVYSAFADIVAASPDNAVIAVDMPIGLPEKIGAAGRGPEKLVRTFLGDRQSSVFSIPARGAVEQHDYREACRMALETSDPPRKVSKQAFHLFPKIREIDALVSIEPALHSRVIECHPEFAFWRLNDGQAMALPKKIKGRVNLAGMEERKHCLHAAGVQRAFLDQAPPKGTGADDCLDATAVLLIAMRFARGEAISFPSPPGRDTHGVPIAIWC